MKHPEEFDDRATAAGYLSACGWQDGEIQAAVYGKDGILGPETRERAAVNEDRARAFAQRFLRPVLDERKARPQFLAELRKKIHMDPWDDVLEGLKSLSGGIVQSICPKRGLSLQKRH